MPSMDDVQEARGSAIGLWWSVTTSLFFAFWISKPAIAYIQPTGCPAADSQQKLNKLDCLFCSV